MAIKSVPVMYELMNICHRTDWPAIECTDGTKSWLINGEELYMNSPNYQCFITKYPDLINQTLIYNALNH